MVKHMSEWDIGDPQWYKFRQVLEFWSCIYSTSVKCDPRYLEFQQMYKFRQVLEFRQVLDMIYLLNIKWIHFEYIYITNCNTNCIHFVFTLYSFDKCRIWVHTAPGVSLMTGSTSPIRRRFPESAWNQYQRLYYHILQFYCVFLYKYEVRFYGNRGAILHNWQLFLIGARPHHFHSHQNWRFGSPPTQANYSPTKT